MGKREWSLLKEKGLAEKLNQILTEHWQRESISGEAADVLDAMYADEAGEYYQSVSRITSKP